MGFVQSTGSHAAPRQPRNDLDTDSMPTIETGHLENNGVSSPNTLRVKFDPLQTHPRRRHAELPARVKSSKKPGAHNTTAALRRDANDSDGRTIPPKLADEHLVFAQYTGRYMRRKESVDVARFKLLEQRNILQNHERWRSEALDTARNEIKEASLTTTSATFLEQAQATLKRMQAAVEQVLQDDKDIGTQRKLTKKCEDVLLFHEERLNRVVHSMIKAAHRCIAQSEDSQTDNTDLISNSTQQSTQEQQSDARPPPPTEVGIYFAAKSDVSIMFERLTELEFERLEEDSRREFERDQGEPVDDDLVQSVVGQISTEIRRATIDYQQARKDLEAAWQACEEKGYKPDDYLNHASDSSESSDTASDFMIRLPKGPISDTDASIYNVFSDTDTLGPDPNDETGLNTIVLQSARSKRLSRLAQPIQNLSSIENWMHLVPDDARPREFATPDTPLGDSSYKDHEVWNIEELLTGIGSGDPELNRVEDVTDHINSDHTMPTEPIEADPSRWMESLHQQEITLADHIDSAEEQANRKRVKHPSRSSQIVDDFAFEAVLDSVVEQLEPGLTTNANQLSHDGGNVKDERGHYTTTFRSASDRGSIEDLQPVLDRGVNDEKEGLQIGGEDPATSSQHAVVAQQRTEADKGKVDPG